jgi:probable dihydroxyacetone kinase regulator
MASMTKRMIAHVFLQLTDEKDVDKITVKDIVERVEITRQTFYYHFQDIFDLIESILEQKMTEIYQKSLEASTMTEALRMLLSIIEEHPSLIRKIQASQHHEQINQLFFQTMIAYFRKMIDTKQLFMDMSRADMEFSLHFYSYGIAGMIFEACQKNRQVDLDKMASQIYKIVTNQN